MTGPRARPIYHLPQSRRARARRRRALIVGLGALLAVAGLTYFLRGHQARHLKAKSTAVASTTTVSGVRTLQATLMPWRLPVALSRTVVLPLHGNLGVFGGLEASDKTTPSILEINPSTGAAKTIASLGRPVHDAAGAVLGAHEFVWGGGASTVTAAVQTYDGSSPTATVSATLPSPRADLVTAQAGGKVLIVGGYDGRRWTPDVLETSDGASFRRLASLPTPVRYPAAIVLGNSLYVIGGERTDGADSTDIQQVDLTSGAAAIVGHLSQGLSHAAIVNMGGMTYLLGGRSGNATIDTVSRFEPGNGTVTAVGRLPLAVSDAGLAVLGDTAYLVGGETGTTPTTTVMAVRLVPA